MSVRLGPSRFDPDTYLAPANEIFTIELTNSAPARSAHPMSATLLISPTSHPVINPVAGKPHMWVAIVDKAVFKAPTVPTAEARSVTMPALPVGDYVLQLHEAWGFHDSPTLLVRT